MQVVLKLILNIHCWSISYQIACRWMLLDLTDDKSSLDEVLRNGLALSSNKPLPEPILTQISVAICYMTSLGPNELKIAWPKFALNMLWVMTLRAAVEFSTIWAKLLFRSSFTIRVWILSGVIATIWRCVGLAAYQMSTGLYLFRCLWQDLGISLW